MINCCLLKFERQNSSQSPDSTLANNFQRSMSSEPCLSKLDARDEIFVAMFRAVPRMNRYDRMNVNRNDAAAPIEGPNLPNPPQSSAGNRIRAPPWPIGLVS